MCAIGATLFTGLFRHFIPRNDTVSRELVFTSPAGGVFYVLLALLSLRASVATRGNPANTNEHKLFPLVFIL